MNLRITPFEQILGSNQWSWKLLVYLKDCVKAQNIPWPIYKYKILYHTAEFVFIKAAIMNHKHSLTMFARLSQVITIQP